MSTVGPLLLTSWDDGTVTDVRMAELLTAYGFRGTFFATTGPADREPATADELHAVAQLGHEIGNHGLSHRSMTELSDAEIVEDVRLGAERCENFMARVSPIVAPPKGHVDSRVLAVLRGEEVLVRRAPIVGSAKPAAGTIEPTVQLFGHSLYRTVGQLARRRVVPERRGLRPLLAHRDLWARMAAIVRAYARSDGPLHVWGHSEELGRLGWWERFEELLALARELGFRGATLGEHYCGVRPAPRLGPPAHTHAP
jgi:peptidoglycan/xylan/chitin deacetylase (PgdA/CDA1 family)